MAHLNESGLQAHSVGDLYPWTIVGTRAPSGKTAWFAWNTIDDTRFPVRAAYKDAELDVARYELALERGQKAAEDIAAAETARKHGEDIAKSLKGLGQDRSRVAEKTLAESRSVLFLVAAEIHRVCRAAWRGHRKVEAALRAHGVEAAEDLRLSQLESFLSRITNP